MLLSVSLELPESSKAASGLDASPRSVNEWISALPRANLAAATRDIYQALRLANGAAVPLDHRLHFLESVARLVEELTPALERFFAEAQWPLAEKPMRVAQAVLSIRQELAIGYRLVLSAERGWRLFGKGSEAHARASARMVRIVSDLLEQCRMLHQPEPPGAWRVMHEAFEGALRNEEAELPVPILNRAPATTTVSREYRRALLRSLLSPADFTREQWRKTQEHLDEWAAMAQLTPRGADCTGVHCVHTDADIGPAMARGRCSGECAPQAPRLHLDTRAIVAQLDAPNPPVQPALAEGLVRAWREPGERFEQRTAAAASLEAAFGFTAIHSLMLHHSGQPQAAPAPAPKLSIEGHAVRPVADVWGTLFIDIMEYQRSNWVEAFGQQQNYATQTILIENSSRNGYCLHLPAETTQPIRVGDIAGFRPADGEWEIAAVRWVQTSGRRRGLFGVRRLLTDARAVVLRVYSPERCSEPLPGFAGTGPDGTPALLVPHIPGRRKRFVLDQQEGGRILATDETVSSGTYYVLYKFHIEKPWQANVRPVAPNIGVHGTAGVDDVWRGR